jgi:hypothetical protein
MGRGHLQVLPSALRRGRGCTCNVCRRAVCAIVSRASLVPRSQLQTQQWLTRSKTLHGTLSSAPSAMYTASTQAAELLGFANYQTAPVLSWLQPSPSCERRCAIVINVSGSTARPTVPPPCRQAFRAVPAIQPLARKPSNTRDHRSSPARKPPRTRRPPVSLAGKPPETSRAAESLAGKPGDPPAPIAALRASKPRGSPRRKALPASPANQHLYTFFWGRVLCLARAISLFGEANRSAPRQEPPSHTIASSIPSHPRESTSDLPNKQFSLRSNSEVASRPMHLVQQQCC